MDKSEILKSIIQNRRSVYPKDYAGVKIPQHILVEILDSANYAPNHKKTKPWRLKIFQNEELLNLGKEIQKIYKETTPPQLFIEKKYNDFGLKISQSDALIPIVVNFSGLVPEWEEISAVAMAVQNMYLTCSVNNVGCYWSSHNVINHLQSFLKLEENQRCIGLFYMGIKRI